MIPEVPADMPRTTCACPECRACCSRQPGPLIPGQLQTIAAHLGKTVREASAYFVASPGGRLANRATGAQLRVGTITPRMKAGRCVFLGPEGACRIHSVAPFGCSHFDTHMSAAEGHRRGVWMMRLQASDEAYQSLRRTLTPAASHRPLPYPTEAHR